MRKNKLSISGTGGGPSQFCPLSSIEEEISNLLHMEEAVSGLPTTSCFGTSGCNTSHVTLVSSDCPEEILDSPQNKNQKLNEDFLTAKRKRLSVINDRENLLKTQVEQQALYQNDSVTELREIRNDLKDLARYARKSHELKKEKLALCKEKFKFKKERNIQNQKIKLEKLELKRKMLELETEKGIRM